MWQCAAPGGIPAAGQPREALWIFMAQNRSRRRAKHCSWLQCSLAVALSKPHCWNGDVLPRDGVCPAPGEAAKDLRQHYLLPLSLWWRHGLAQLQRATPCSG